MNISYNWLKDYLNFNLSPEELAAALTSIGLEVGNIEETYSIKGGLKGIVVGEVLKCEPHPNSDHMFVTSVDIGQGENIQIVCGASNIATNQKVLVATLGTQLYTNEKCYTIKKTKLRGVESNGMICAEDEIGIGKSHDGIIVLPSNINSGTPARDVYDLQVDYILEVDITPNRADACSHYGVARDLYAYLIQRNNKVSLAKPAVENIVIKPFNKKIAVSIENKEACPIYAGILLENIKIDESPIWLQNKLKAIGLHTINNVIDATNYILHAFGQPLHCYDADKIAGNKIIIKTLSQGKYITTLDGVERKLTEHDLVICNKDEAMCLAGIIGGRNSEVTNKTKNVFLESAYFNPTWIRKTSRRQGISTDASFRYERGVDPNINIYCLKLAAKMICELAKCENTSWVVNEKYIDTSDFRVNLSYSKISSLIGISIPDTTIKSILQSLEMKIVNESTNEITIDIPRYRVDVQRDCDVIEDIIRIYGYDNLSTVDKGGISLISKKGNSYNEIQNSIADLLTNNGFIEIQTNSLTKKGYYTNDNIVTIINPLSQDLNAMRQSLLFGGLETIAYNLNRKNNNIKIYEFGRVYSKNTNKESNLKYTEENQLAVFVVGDKFQTNWKTPATVADFYYLKGYIEQILVKMNIDTDKCKKKQFSDRYLMQGITYDIDNKVILQMGIVDKNRTNDVGIKIPVYYAVLFWDTILSIRRKSNSNIIYKELPKYPEVKRDLSIVVKREVSYEEIKQCIRKNSNHLVNQINLFDVYRGSNISDEDQSLAISFYLQDFNKTLTDKEIEVAVNKIGIALKSNFGAIIREK